MDIEVIHIQVLAILKQLFGSLPPFLHDQYARGVVVCCESAVSYLACLLAGLFTYLLTY